MGLPAEALQISPSQCRVARVLLRWSKRELAERASLPLCAVVDFERGIEVVSAEDVARARFALEDSGVEFFKEKCGGPDVRLSKFLADSATPREAGQRPQVNCGSSRGASAVGVDRPPPDG
jgi:hypothetical protein